MDTALAKSSLVMLPLILTLAGWRHWVAFSGRPTEQSPAPGIGHPLEPRCQRPQSPSRL